MPVEIPKELPLLGKLPAHWRAVEFGSVLDGGTRNGIYKQKEFHGRGAKMVNMGELFAHPRLRAAVEMRRVELSDNEHERFNLRSGDLLFARRSLVASGAGKCIVVLEINEPTTFESSIIRARPNLREADGLFLFYLFSSPYGTYVLGSILRHVAVAGITGSDLVKLLIPLPPPAEQRAIASVLGALDDKIELNRRMNETLEALAQSLFKSWFVDATQSARPKGWRAGTLGEIVELRTDRIDATPAKDTERYIALEDMPSKSIDLSNYQAGSAVNSSIIRFRKGDVLFGSMRPYFHKVGLASFDGITRTTTFVLRPKQNHLRHFALFHFFSNEVIEFSTTSSVGTTIPYIKWDALERYQIALPPDARLAEFEMAVAPLVQHIANNGEESRTLAALRDALLPKLLSGELRVHADDKYLEDNK